MSELAKELVISRRNSNRLSSTLDHKLKEHEWDFTDYIPIKVQCVTWNVNSCSPTEEIRTLFQNDVLPDIISFSIQEMDMSLDSVVLNDVKFEEEWIYTVRKVVGTNYFMVGYKRLAGIFLIVMALNSRKNAIKYVSTSYAATGILGLMGNKGAVAISFDFHQSSLCFVSSHLAAHLEEVEKRNQNFSLINSKMSFSSTKSIYTIRIQDHDAVFWCGDLNYRIANLTMNQILADIYCQSYDKLLENDQLIIEKGAKRAFVRYKEAKITFPPTYKFITGTDQYDTVSGRTPAWCDRILWLQNNPRCDIKMITYGSNSLFTNSDHKPVFGTIDMKVCAIDDKKFNSIVESVRLAMDAQENQMIPSVKLSCNDLIFADVHYKEPQFRSISLFNNGSCDVHFQFASRSQSIHSYDPEFFCPSWLTISQNSGYIPIGQGIEIDFEVNLTKKDVAKIDEDNPRLSSILILHLAEGRDYFICVDCNYVPSCFGSSLKKLTQLDKPFKNRNTDEPPSPLIFNDFICSRLSKKYNPRDIPKELINLSSCLCTYGIDTPGIFTHVGFFEELKAIMKALDYSTLPIQSQFKKLSIHSMAECYLLFLDMLKQPLIPVSYVSPEIFNDGKINPSKFMDKLDQVTKTVLVYVLTFIDEIIKHKDQNRADPFMICTVFSNVLIRHEVNSENSFKVIPVRNSIKVIMTLLKHCVV